MTTKGLIDFKTVIILLVIFILSSIAFLIVLRIDLLVHVDLYDYGLQFNTLWANEYWQIKNMLLVFIAGAATLSVLSMIPHFDYSKQPTKISKWTGTLLPIIAIIYMIFSISSFLRIDDIIQNVLPQYNLIINYVWTAEYWNLNSIALTLMIVSLLLLIIPTIRTSEILELELA
jgi:hypothetical protein